VLFLLFNIFEEQVVSYLKPIFTSSGWHVQPIFYILKTFPYVATFDAWIGATNRYGGIV
jgi:hypothetical protein